MIEATCSACGTVNRIAEADAPLGAKFVSCASCKSRVNLPAQARPLPPVAGPKPIGIPKIPGPTMNPEIADLPAPKRGNALGGLEASKPAPRSALEIADLPTPKGSSSARSRGGALDLDDLLPAPKGPTASGISDLPAPKQRASSAAPPLKPAPAQPPEISDLPTPKGPAQRSDLPAPKRASATSPVGAPVVASALELDLGAPLTSMGGSDLPAPKGFFDDLPQPARRQAAPATPHADSSDLPAPKGFFDDLPQPARKQAIVAAAESDELDLPAPKGFFDDLPQPAR